MGRKSRYPMKIQTDMGNTVVKVIPSRKATKIHKCPSCESNTQYCEEHLILLPTAFPGNRRYMHTRCFEELLRNNVDIVLHPNLSYLSPDYDT